MFKNRSFMLGLGVGIIAGALLLQLMMLAQSGRPEQPAAANVPAAEQTGTGGADALLSGADETSEPSTDDKAQTQSEQPASEEADVSAEAEPQKSAADARKDTAVKQEAPASGEAAQSTTDSPSKPTSQATQKPAASAPQSTEKSASPTAQKPQTPAAQSTAKPSEPAKTAEPEKSAQAPSAPTKPETSGNVEAQRSEEAESSRVSFEIESGMNLKAVSKALESAGIVKDASDFQRQAAEAGVTAKLQVGDYSFKPGDSYSDIIKEISTPKVE
ncbi:hypothetical protein CDO73_20405 [Saccharibacillus sp. O23]|uniref:endolytic transglycosylase MltG n=1 Tax=Saccharibacillus sp. O23 TaxID=2009338 RepID=UPI000B4E4FB2|nr:endolytic transglycosylase MltG [Saccharibacillus sp. O23]OWR27873.1 hypothetical protein CDO73_20405 [Saccharibacillus sp. O23]